MVSPADKIKAIASYIEDFDDEVAAADTERYVQLIESHLGNLEHQVADAEDVLAGIGQVDESLNKAIERVNEATLHAIQTIESKASVEKTGALIVALTCLGEFQSMISEFNLGDDSARRRYKVDPTDTDMGPAS